MDLAITGLPWTLAQEETETTEEQPEEHGNPILPEADELLWGGIAFILVFLVLAKYAFPRLDQGLKQRTEKIQGDLERAENARTEAETQLSRYEEQLREARAEAGRIIDEARKTAESMRRDLVAKAEDESRQIVERAQEEIRAERDRAFQGLRSQVGELSVELATRVVGESLDRERQLRLVEGYIEEVARMGGGNGHGARAPEAEGGRAPGEQGRAGGTPPAQSTGEAGPEGPAGGAGPASSEGPAGGPGAEGQAEGPQEQRDEPPPWGWEG